MFNPLSLLGSLQGKLIALAVGSILVASGGFWAGFHWESVAVADLKLADARAAAQAVKIAAETQKKDDAISLAAAPKEAKAQAKIITNTITITKEVPRYVTVQADVASCIPIGLARVLRAAADGSDPAALSLAPGQSDDACSDVTASEVAGWFADFAGTSRANAEQLNALEDWNKEIAR